MFFSIDPDRKEEVIREIGEILRSVPEILFAYIHGSFLMGRFRDVDIAVYLRGSHDKKSILKTELKLEELLERKIGYAVDVRVLNQAPLSFRFNVIRHGELVFSRDENLRSDFEALTISEYHDFAHFRRVYMREALGIEVQP